MPFQNVDQPVGWPLGDQAGKFLLAAEGFALASLLLAGVRCDAVLGVVSCTLSSRFFLVPPLRVMTFIALVGGTASEFSNSTRKESFSSALGGAN
jgi:hypothetical protein